MWIKLWVSGKGKEVDYRYADDSLRGEDEELKTITEEWARNTSIGLCAEYYRFGYEEVKELPDRVRDELMSTQRRRIAHANAILKALESVSVITCCRRHYDCTEPAVKEGAIVDGPNKVGATVPMCDSCYRSNESMRQMYERMKAQK